MAAFSKEKNDEYIALLRRCLVRKGDLTINEAYEALAKHPIRPVHLGKDYIQKLLNKIHKERTVRLNRHTIEFHLARFEDECEDLKQRLYSIIADQGEGYFVTDSQTQRQEWVWKREPPSYAVRVVAIREIRETSKVLFDKMFDAGIFEKKIGELKMLSSFSPEQEAVMNKIWNHAIEPNEEREQFALGSPSDSSREETAVR